MCIWKGFYKPILQVWVLGSLGKHPMYVSFGEVECFYVIVLCLDVWCPGSMGKGKIGHLSFKRSHSLNALFFSNILLRDRLGRTKMGQPHAVFFT